MRQGTIWPRCYDWRKGGTITAMLSYPGFNLPRHILFNLLRLQAINNLTQDFSHEFCGFSDCLQLLLLFKLPHFFNYSEKRDHLHGWRMMRGLFLRLAMELPNQISCLEPQFSGVQPVKNMR